MKADLLRITLEIIAVAALAWFPFFLWHLFRTPYVLQLAAEEGARAAEEKAPKPQRRLETREGIRVLIRDGEKLQASLVRPPYEGAEAERLGVAVKEWLASVETYIRDRVDALAAEQVVKSPGQQNDDPHFDGVQGDYYVPDTRREQWHQVNATVMRLGELANGLRD